MFVDITVAFVEEASIKITILKNDFKFLENRINTCWAPWSVIWKLYQTNSVPQY